MNSERIVTRDGTSILEIIFNGETKRYINSVDYTIFFNAASDYILGLNRHRISLRGSDLTGPNYKHVFVGETTRTYYDSDWDATALSATLYAAFAGMFGLPYAGIATLVTIAIPLITTYDPYKLVVNSGTYEVKFTYDNVYYTHCYHLVLKCYGSGNHLLETGRDYYQSVGG